MVPIVLNVESSVDGVVVGMVGTGLRPPAPSSVEPIGIPTRPTVDAEPIPVGDEADAAGPAKEPLAVEGQVPDAVPATPPPSNTVGDIEVPAVEVPVPNDVPAIELPMPDDELPTPGDETPVPDAVTEVPRPNDDSAIEPPMPRHPELVTGAGPNVDVPGVIGLTPGDASSVAPRGTRAGGTGEAGPMPRGDVVPSGETCAKAGAQPKSTAAVVAITKRVIEVSIMSVSSSPQV